MVIAVACLLSGCATNVPMSGKTVAVGRAKTDVFKALPAYAAVMTHCKEPIRHIRTETAKTSERFDLDDEGRLLRGQIIERWHLTMCGREEIVYVTFTADGRGGSCVALSRELDTD